MDPLFLQTQLPLSSDVSGIRQNNVEINKNTHNQKSGTVTSRKGVSHSASRIRSRLSSNSWNSTAQTSLLRPFRTQLAPSSFSTSPVSIPFLCETENLAVSICVCVRRKFHYVPVLEGSFILSHYDSVSGGSPSLCHNVSVSDAVCSSFRNVLNSFVMLMLIC